MNFVALISGGKDSMYTIYRLQKEGYILTGLVYMHDTSNTIDSYMFQSVGCEVIDAYATCLNVPLYRYETRSRSINKNLQYSYAEEDEIEDLYNALKSTKSEKDFSFVSSGAILSTYQKNRVENVCKRLGLVSLTPLWQMDQKCLLDEMINSGMESVIVKVATPGLGRNCIGMNLVKIRDIVSSIRYCNVCGEGGEYETVTLYMPGFTKRLVLISYDVLRHLEEAEKEWNVFFMGNIKYRLEEI